MMRETVDRRVSRRAGGQRRLRTSAAFAVLAACGLAAESRAQQTWIGPSPSLFSTPANWSGGTVPGSTNDALVSGSNPVVIQLSQAATVNGLTVLSPSLTLTAAPSFSNSSAVIVRNGGLTLNNGATLFIGDSIAGLGASVTVGQLGAINSTGGGRILLRAGVGTGASGATLTATAEQQAAIPIAAGILIEGRGTLAGPWTNRGTIGSGPGTGLTITGTVNQLEAGTIIASDDAGQARAITLFGARIFGGTLRASGSSTIAVRNEFSSNSVTLGGVVSDGGLNVESGRLRIDPAGLTLASDPVLAVSPNTTADAIVELGGLISGTGSIVLNALSNDVTSAQLVPSVIGGGILGPLTRVTGSGIIGITQAAIRNRGLIADGPTIQGQIDQDPAGRLSAGAADVSLTTGARVSGGRLESTAPRAILIGQPFSSTTGVPTVSGVTLAGELRNSTGRARIDGSPGLIAEPGAQLTIGGPGTTGATVDVTDGSLVDGPLAIRFLPSGLSSSSPPPAPVLTTPNAQSVGLLGPQVVVQGPGVISGLFASQARIESDVTITGVFTQVAPGRIAPSSGQVTLGGGARVVGGRFEPATGAAVSVASSSTNPVVSDVVCSGLLRLVGGARLRIDAPGLTIEPSGRLLVNPTASTTDTLVDFGDGAVLDGRIDLNGNAADSTSAQLTTVTGATGALGAQAVVRGTGQITGSFVNLGRIGQNVTVLGSLLQGETGSIDPESGTATLGNLARVTGGTLRTSGGIIQTGSTTSGNVSTSTLTGVTSAATVHVLDNWRLRIAGAGLSGQPGSRIVVNAASNPTLPSILEIADASTIGGTTVIQLLGNYADLTLTRIEVAAGSGASIGSGVRIEGRGLLDGRLTIAGTIAPGSPTSEAQLLYRSGLSLTPESRVEIDFSGPIVAQRDLIAAAAPAPLGASIALDGTLSVRLVGPYRPTQCETIPVISGPYSRLFARVEQPATGPGSFEPVYGTGGVSVRYRPFDANGNLVADVEDIFVFLNEWFRLSPRADADGLGGANIADIFWFLSAWFGSTCP